MHGTDVKFAFLHHKQIDRFYFVWRRTEHRYIFVFDPQRASELINRFGVLAGDDAYDFTWVDATVAANLVRKFMKGRQSESQSRGNLNNP